MQMQAAKLTTNSCLEAAWPAGRPLYTRSQPRCPPAPSSAISHPAHPAYHRHRCHASNGRGSFDQGQGQGRAGNPRPLMFDSGPSSPSSMPLPFPSFPSLPFNLGGAPGPVLSPSTPLEGSFKASGKTVVITGGSQGIGRATALLFAKKGFNVVIAARDPTNLQYAANDCAEAAGRTGASLGVVCDVTNERQVKDLANTVLSKFENIDVLVNCAGIMARGAFVDVPAQEAERLMQVNYMGVYHVTQAFVPMLKGEAQKSKGGARPSIIMVNGFAGKVPMKNMSAFTASKYALMGWTQAIRAELGPMGIHVGAVHPGVVKSSIMERASFFGQDESEDRKSYRQAVRALPISQSPHEVAEAIYNASQSKAEDVVVGLPFAAVELAHRLTGISPFAMSFLP